MLNKLRKSNTQGFTIIEVMIVLAIAGLILLIVLLAVPALQRNARNTSIKNDASALAAGFSEYLSNNNGVAPASISQTGADVIVGAAGSAQANVKVSGSTTVTIAKTTPTAFAAGTLYWNTGRTCPTSSAPTGVANPRSITVFYYLESSGTPSNTPQCVDAA